MKRIFFSILFIIIISGCTGIAVLPAKIVYMYPTGELYDQPEANGALAKIDNGTLNLYLPMFSEDSRKPTRFQFTWIKKSNMWESKDGNITIEYVSKNRNETLESGEILNLITGMLLVKFSDDSINGNLSGKMIWLSPNVGPSEFKKVIGLYTESDADYTQIFEQ